MRRPTRSARIALSATLALTAVAGGVAAQIPDQLNMGPSTPGVPNFPPISFGFGQHLLLGIGYQPTPLVLPGVYGAVQIGLAGSVMIQNRAGWGPELVPVAPLLPGPSTPLTWQVLGPEETGLGFSPVRPLIKSVGFAQIETEAEARIRAAQHIAEVAGQGMAPNWQGSQGPGEGTPFYRPDVSGVAYYHFDVDGGGYIVLSTGDHDAPVSHWRDDGEPLTDTLNSLTQGRAAIAKFYRMDMASWVGEDAQGNLVAQIGQLPPKLVPTEGGEWDVQDWSSWDELKSDYFDTYRPLIENEAMRVARLWEGVRSGEDGPWSSWAATWTRGATSGQCLYDQFTYNGCEVGCGPVAWAMLFGWADRRADLGDPDWSYRWGLYRQDGGRGFDDVAPRFTTTGARNVIKELNDEMGTFCLLGNGATLPGDMQKADRYLSGRTYATIETHFDKFGIQSSGLHDLARDDVLNEGKPSIIGTGWLTHYPVVVGFATRSRERQVLFWTERETQNVFYLNLGWGGRSNGWYDTGTWFCGRIFNN